MSAPHEEAAERLRKEMRGQGHDGDLFDDLRLVLDEYAERGRKLDEVTKDLKEMQVASREPGDGVAWCMHCEATPFEDMDKHAEYCPYRLIHAALAKLGGEGE